MRVLHVVGGLGRGGIETWLMNMLRHHKDAAIEMIVLSTKGVAEAHSAEIESLGFGLHYLSGHRRPVDFARQFRKFLRDEGPFDIVHSHVDHFSGFILLVAKMAGVPVRVAHSHNDTRAETAQLGIGRRGYVTMANAATRFAATAGFACSPSAAAAMFGDGWARDGRWSALPYGLEFPEVDCVPRSAGVRREFGIPTEALIVGHVGRFSPQKNHLFLVEAFSKLAASDARVHLALLGNGDVPAELSDRIAQLAMTRRVHILGARPDVPRLMMGLFDAFVLPSTHEGLGIVAVEAQAAGLPTLISDRVPPEAVVVPQLVSRKPLEDGADEWAAAMLTMLTRSRLPADRARQAMKESPFNLERCYQTLVGRYRTWVVSDHASATRP